MSKIEKDTNDLIDSYNLDYNPVYKINYMLDGNINTIYVFNEKYDKNTDKNILINKIFNDKEKTFIQNNNINVQFSNQQIHLDDSIGTIKLKILNEIKKNISIDEIYLYCEKIEKLNSESLYQSLTQNKKLELTKVRLQQFLSNIVSNENGEPFKTNLDKDIYTYDDILEMKLDNKKYIVNKVLGQRFFLIENEYPFICNPYDVTNFDALFEKNSRKSLTTLNSNLLLNNGQIIDNDIYLCIVSDVLKYLSKKNVPQETTIKIYYPFLYNKNINNLDDINSSREKLIEGNKKFLNNKTLDLFKTIDMFYDIYKLKKTNLNYIKRGIKYIKAVIKPDVEIKIPLEVIFKIIHATNKNPLIKYNPSTRQENMYRLYTDKISTDGRKIPYLKKASIFKLIKNIAKTKSVSVYIENIINNELQTLVCEFDENGYITIYSEFNNIVNLIDIDKIFGETINPIIQEIQNLLEQSGYKLNKFTSLTSENIEIKQLTYETQLTIKKQFDYEKYKGCFSSVFINETNIYKNKNINLRFKRVSNYSKVTSQEAFILEKSEQGYRGAEIIEALIENFPDDLNYKEAEELVRKIANEIQVERGARKTDIKIKENPGFKTIISIEKESGIIKIIVENINDISYLQTIPVYLDTIIRLTQDKNSTNYPVKEINKLCLANEKEDLVIPDIISSSELSVSENEIPSFDEDTEEIEYTKYKDIVSEKPKGAFSLFYDEDEEYVNEDEDEISSIKGGDSESSISSDKGSIENKITYNGVTIPTGISLSSTEESIPSEKVLSPLQVEKPETKSSEPSVSSEKVMSPLELEKPETKSSEPSVSSEKVMSPLEVEKPETIVAPVEVKKTAPKLPPLQVEESETSEDDENIAEEDEDQVRNIDGMKLNKPYYFQTLIEEKDPVLILKEDTPQYNAYSRTCSSDTRRQPVILTDNQLEKINKEHPGFLKQEDVIKYGSNPKNQYNYICPRYWCLKNNTIIDPNELKEVTNKDGKKELVHPTCGKVLPKSEKKVKPGYYIYEFYQPKQGKKDYKKYPGFITDSHPEGFCLPCCFDKYNTQGRIEAKNKCYAKPSDKENIKKEIHKKEKVDEIDEYIKGPEKFPLEPRRWGYLPGEIQKMLLEINADCQGSKSNVNIKDKQPCLLRHGIEVNEKQSFIACISDAIFFGKKVADKNTEQISKILDIKDMKERIIKSLTIDNFIKYQNGNLVLDFYDENKKVEIQKYTNTNLYSKLNINKVEDKSYYTKVISAYENFIDFLNDDNVIIDHTYLWDIISKPNKYLFPNGINLIIFQLPDDDITNNVQLICPTNHYSNEFYEARKPSLFLMKKDGYYEPIYSYMVDNKKIIVAKEFKEYDPHLSKTMRSVFKEIIKPFFNMICKPLDSMPNIYTAKKSIILYDLVQKLDKYEYKILKLVMNFNNKVIGVVAKENDSEKSCFIPCYPSALDVSLKKDLDYVFMTDLSLWNTYEDTILFLRKLEKRSKKRKETSDIPCKPIFKIVEDELVVGILTETNQFIQISTPIPEINIKADLNISSIKNSNYIIKSKNNEMLNSDIPITTSNNIDTERVDYIKKIQLETKFYNVFRNTIRLLINDYNNFALRENIEDEMSKQYIIYSEKLNKIEKLLRKLVKDKIQFIGDENYYKLISEVSTCIVKSKTDCNTSNLCVVNENGNCNLILPEKNLITNKKNEDIYFNKMADELIRYNRIKSFMLQPQTYLSFNNISYNLRDDEIILMQSLLTQEYFETLLTTVSNKYVKHNSYDEVEPIITQTYENKITLKNNKFTANIETCDKIVKENITSSYWKKVFPNNYKEIKYSNNYFCTFEVIIDLIENKTGNKFTINQIKNELYEEYKKYLNDYKDKIVDILIIEGKKTLGDLVNTDTLSFSSFIYTDNYFLTTFDLWLLVNKYEIPTIFISQKYILQTKYEKNIFVGFANDSNDKFVFILIPGFRPENIPSLKVIETDKKHKFISLDELNNDYRNQIENDIYNKITISEYLKNFTKPAKTQYEKKKPVRLEIESDTEEDKINPKPKSKIAKLVIEESSPITPEEFILKPKTKKTKKKQIVLKGTEKTKKNIKKTLIIEDISEKI
jgi:hypothetical protein